MSTGERWSRVRGTGWLVFASVLALVVTVAFGVWFHQRQESQLKQQAERELANIAVLKVDQLVQWRRDRVADGDRATNGPGMGALAAQWIADASAIESSTMTRALESQRYGDRYRGVVLASLEGEVLTGVGEPRTTLGVETREAIERLPEERQALLTELYENPVDGSPDIDVVAPLYDPASDRMVAAIVLSADGRDFLFSLLQRWPTPSPTSETLMVRREGDEVLFLNDVRHRDDTALSMRIPMTSTRVPAVQAVLGRTGTFEGSDYRGVPVLSYLSQVPGSSWYLVSKVDRAEAFQPWRTQSQYILALVVLLAGGVIGMALIGWQRMRAERLAGLLSTERTKREAEERLAVTLASIGDGVISTDSACKVEFMNPVAEELTGWTLHEARGRDLETVFPIFNEDTGATVENPVVRVMREGRVVGLANHTELEDRSGHRRAIADSGAPVRDASGEITGAVLVFRDQAEEREAARLLAESERRFRSLVEGAPDGIFVQAGGRFVYVNEAAARLYGARNAGDLLGRSVFERFREDYHELVRERIERLEQTGEPQRAIDQVHLRLDGTELPVEVSAVPIGYQDKPAALVFVRDATERLRSQAVDKVRSHLLEFEHDHTLDELLTEAVDCISELVASPIGFFHVVEPDETTVTLQAWSTGTFTGFCERGGKGVHYPVREAGIWADCIRARQPVVHNDYASEAGRRGLPEGHGRLVRDLVAPVFRNNQVVAVLGVGNNPEPYTADDVRTVSYLADIAWEIAQYKRAEQAIRANDELLQVAGSLARLGAWRFDFTDDSLYWSPEVRRIHRVPADYTPVVEHAIEFYAPEYRDRITEVFERCASEGVPYDEQLQIITADGVRLWVHTFGVPITDESGTIVGVQGGFQDITERRQVEAELERHRDHLEELVAERTRELEATNAELAEATRAKSRFLANMSHELRTPMNSIIGFSGLLSQGMSGELTDEQRSQVDLIYTAGKHLLELINSVLDISKVEAGRFDVSATPVELNGVACEVAETLRALAYQKRLELICEDGNGPVEIVTDAGKVKQILVNLVGNAIKFTHEGAVRIAVTRGDGVVRITVADTGLGMPRCDLDRIFEPFAQLECPGQQRTEGTGLGLALAREYARLLGGDIVVESTEGEGSRFTLLLPDQ